MRAWKIPQSPEEGTEPLKNLSMDKAHHAQINVVEESHDGLELYSGSKDGVVNIWTLQGADVDDAEGLALVHSGQIQAQGSSVTAISAIAPDATCHGKMVIYGGTDKTLRICRAKDAGDSYVSTGVPDQANEEDVMQ